ncbi:hypothetical protein [Lactobacillus jensenii]|uniref:Uncharacterized protein n=1 Tax=Lactobacillus jensenii TaxID=109790 RepID=A0ABU9FH59_LACJE|nr:hypothetical protein [Lactobacillus jensenii]DAR66700.1 MAG TPA: protein of unknown function (DUF5053) [Caudoviricetes sp.]MCW8072191.1 hypothetical protein [Lactobacillus jensenii]MDK8236063.1 hypothetical protein [Lactobacillus jensenii]MDT9544351.1 hypothetical protein [Lactobacillus jensenii]MDT9586812.1 hypothetical protein [Lactobacillus jensenii]
MDKFDKLAQDDNYLIIDKYYQFVNNNKPIRSRLYNDFLEFIDDEELIEQFYKSKIRGELEEFTPEEREQLWEAIQNETY